MWFFTVTSIGNSGALTPSYGVMEFLLSSMMVYGLFRVRSELQAAMPPHTSPYLPIPPHTSPYLPISSASAPSCRPPSPYLPIPPHISPYLPISPHTSPYLPTSPQGRRRR